MKFTLTVDSPREASYAMSMFGALHGAMLDDPPPARSKKSETYAVGDVSHTVMTDSAIRVPNYGTDTDAEIARDTAQAVAAGADPAAALAAATEKKKRGRKSQADKDAEAAAKAALTENALQPGAALKGVDAQTLAQALGSMPLVFEGEGVQMRVAPGTSPEEIAEIQKRLATQEVTKVDPAAAAAEAQTPNLESLFGLANAGAAAATTTTTTAAGVVSGTPTVVEDDLAALFRKPQAATPPTTAQATTSRFAALSGPALMAEFTDYINKGGGIFWARAVMQHYNLEVLNDLTEAQIRDALENPDKFPKTGFV